MGVDCSYCRAVARPDIFFWPMVQFDKETVAVAVQKKYPQLKELGDIANISAVKQSDYPDFSRITMVKLTGTNGALIQDVNVSVDSGYWNKPSRTYNSSHTSSSRLAGHWLR